MRLERLFEDDHLVLGRIQFLGGSSGCDVEDSSYHQSSG
jgi:hypothetical protein